MDEDLKHRIRNSQGAEFIRRVVSLYDGMSVVDSPSGDQIIIVRDPRSPAGIRAESLSGAGYGEGLSLRDIRNNAVDPLFRPVRSSGLSFPDGKPEIAYPSSDEFLERKATAIPTIRRAFVGPRGGYVRRSTPRVRSSTQGGKPDVSSNPRFLPLRGERRMYGFPLRRNRPEVKMGFPSPTFGPSTGKYRVRWDGPFNPLGWNFPFEWNVWGPVTFRYEINPVSPWEEPVFYHHGNSDYDRLEPPIAPLRQVLPVNGGVLGEDGIWRVPRHLYRFSFVSRPEDEDFRRLMPSAFSPTREERLPVNPIYIPGYRPLISPSLPRGREEEEDYAPYLPQPARIPSPLRKRGEEEENETFNPPRIPGFSPDRLLSPKRRERVRRSLPRVGSPGRPDREKRRRDIDWDKLIKPYRIPQPWEYSPRELQPGLPPTRGVRIYFPPSRLSVPVRELELEGVKQSVRPPIVETVPECRYRELRLSGKLTATACGATQPQEIPYEGRNFKGIESQLAALSEKLDLLISGLCDRPAIAASPEWWQLRPGSDRPQLILLFAPEPDPGQSRESAKWQVSIPHYRGPRLTESPLPAYIKGNCMGRLILKDGSAVIVNTVDELEAHRVLGILSALVDPIQLEGSAIATSQRLGKPVRVQNMRACYARYFSSGQRSGIPDWYTKFD